MTQRSSCSTLLRCAAAALAVCGMLSACAPSVSLAPPPNREPRAMAATQPDGRVALTDGWGRPIAQPAEAAPRPAQVPAPGVTATAVPPGLTLQPAAVSPPPDARSTELALRNALEEWRRAWARGDAEAYLEFYDPAFKGNARTRADWERQRRQRLANGGIELDFSDVRVVRAGTDEGELRFVQHYKSARHSDNGTKLLKLQRVGGEWKIATEAWAQSKP